MTISRSNQVTPNCSDAHFLNLRVRTRCNWSNEPIVSTKICTVCISCTTVTIKYIISYLVQ